MARPEYTRNELKVLWYLKRHGPMTNNNPVPGVTESSIPNRLAAKCDIRTHTISYILRSLETKCLVIRTYRGAKSAKFADGPGYNPMVKLELVDPNMWLPELPAPPPLAAVLNHENEELHERTAHLPTVDRTIEMLLDRLDEYKAQIDKLCGIVRDVTAERDSLQHRVTELQRPAMKHVSEPSTHRIQEHLTPEQWDDLRHTE